MAPRYDPSLIARIFDEYGDAEWARHEVSPAARVAFHVHRHYLDRFVRPGDRVLEVGAGAGRFTVELARLRARVTVVDVSPGQLELNERHVRDAGLEAQVEARREADVLDLSDLAASPFDAVVCFGGPISWVLDDAGLALTELLSATDAGGHLLLSVMSRLGSLRAFLDVAAEEIEEFGLEEMRDIVETGFLPDHHSSLGPMHLYTWHELRALLLGHACEIVVASATNFLSIGNDETCERWLADPLMWKRFLDWEVDACAQPGAIDGGTHILAIVRPVSS